MASKFRSVCRMLCILYGTLMVLAIVDSVEIKSSTHDLKMQVDEEKNWTVELSEDINETAIISIKNIVPEVQVLPTSRNVSVNDTDGLRFSFLIKALDAGHFVISLNATPDYIDDSNAFVRLEVMHIWILDIVSEVIGWIYTIAWVVSYFPQIYINWKRKSVVGLSFDFLGLNITGFLGYSIYNICLMYLKGVREEYFSLHPKGIISVEINDVIFALGGFIATFTIIIQCFIYERGNQTMSKLGITIVAGLWGSAIIYLVIVLTGILCNTPWLNYLYYLSYIKLGITFVKYVPQAYLNYSRKSTVGWSIGNVLLDLTGGIFSILQMFILAYNYNDWSSIFGNFAKFGVAMFSILFDILFVVQHFILYTKREDEMQLLK